MALRNWVQAVALIEIAKIGGPALLHNVIAFFNSILRRETIQQKQTKNHTEEYRTQDVLARIDFTLYYWHCQNIICKLTVIKGIEMKLTLIFKFPFQIVYKLALLMIHTDCSVLIEILLMVNSVTPEKDCWNGYHKAKLDSDGGLCGVTAPIPRLQTRRAWRAV